MRLTLRTMLCYLDDVLEPADAAELGKKIEDSEYASQVVHRIRTSMRRLRLGSPKLGGEGAGFDPNVVADYLDNTLPPEQVADFERVCLDPDTEAQLAEVAACHQILTLVLGEPAEVPQAMRQRIYHLAHPDAIAARQREAEITTPKTNGVVKEVAASAAATTAVSAPPSEPQALVASSTVSGGAEAKPADSAELAKHARQKPEIPEYLKEGSRRSWWPALIVLSLVGVAIAGIGYTTFFKDKTPTTAQNETRDKPDGLFADGELDKPKTLPLTSEAGKNGGDETSENERERDRLQASDAGKPETACTESTTKVEPIAAEAGDGPANTDLELDVAPAESVPPAGTSAGEPTAPPADPTDDTSVAKIDPIDAAKPDGEGAALPLVDRVIGHYISSGEVLVALDNKTESWNRLATRTGVKPGMHLRSLPIFRPQVLLENGVQVTFLGDGEMIVGNPTTEGTHFLNMPYGRALLATMSKAGAAVVVRAGDREALLTFVNADAAVALEISRFHSPGTDPLSEPAHVRATVTVTSGQVTWQEVEREAVTLDAGQQLQMLDENIAVVSAVAETPKWIRLSDISDIDRRACVTLEPLLNAEGPLEIKLEELADDPRVEVRSLAIRSLAGLDRYGRIFETLKDESLKSYWAQHLEQLNAALGRGPAVVGEIRAAALRANAADGETMYRLLWGFSPEQLKAAGAKQLVETLKHPSLDMRVVASNLLRTITGRTQGYNPHFAEARRRTSQRQWEQSLAAGEIVYATPPAALPSRKPREMP